MQSIRWVASMSIALRQFRTDIRSLKVNYLMLLSELLVYQRILETYLMRQKLSDDRQRTSAGSSDKFIFNLIWTKYVRWGKVDFLKNHQIQPTTLIGLCLSKPIQVSQSQFFILVNNEGFWQCWSRFRVTLKSLYYCGRFKEKHAGDRYGLT